VTVKIKQGEFVIILGNSGGGKTSLLNILGTIDKLTKVNIRDSVGKLRVIW
jgi:putative ABC transport system ATP-binding protein